MNDEIRAYINSIKMPVPGCRRKEGCAHYYEELRIGEEFIKGEFCTRFEDWDGETVRSVCNGEFTNCHRPRGVASYAAIERGRDFSPGVLDLNKMFCLGD